MNYIDISVFAVIVLMTLWGYIKGFVVSVLRTFSLFIALFTAKSFYLPFSSWLQQAVPSFREEIRSVVESFLLESIANKKMDLVSLMGDRASGGLRIPGDISADASTVIRQTPALKKLLDSLTENITGFVADCIGFLVLFFIILLIVEFLIFLLNRIRKLPIIGTFDRLLGGFLGMVQALILVTLILFILKSLGNAGIAVDVAKEIEGSFAGRFFLDWGGIIRFVSGVVDFSPRDFIEGLDLEFIF